MTFPRRRGKGISDEELDALLAGVRKKQLAEITRRLDLDAAFQAALDAVADQGPPETPTFEAVEAWPDAYDGVTQDIDSSAASAVCDALTELDVVLDRLADTADAARAHTARSTGFVMMAGGHLTGLIRGLAQRTLTGPQALGAFDLVEHNLREASLLLRGERDIARSRPVREACQERSTVLASAVASLPELRGRVAALFDDAPHPADFVGAPG